MHKDFYEILQVDPAAELEVIKAAFKALAQKYHPDRSKKPESESFMKSLNLAYAVLSDPEQRARYDQESHAKSKNSSTEGLKGQSNSMARSKDHILAVSNVLSSIISKNSKMNSRETDEHYFHTESHGTSIYFNFVDKNDNDPVVYLYDNNGNGVTLDYLAGYISNALDDL